MATFVMNYKDWWIFREVINGSTEFYISFEDDDRFFPSIEEAKKFIDIITADRDELVKMAFDLARSDMSIACFETEAETMKNTLEADDDTLRGYLISNIEFF